MSALPSVPATEPSPVSISTDPSRLDVPWVLAAMRSLPGGEGVPDGQARQALHGSLVFGAYISEPLSEEPPGWHDGLAKIGFSGGPDSWKRAFRDRQIGVVRVVTDGAIFSSVTDTYVDAAHRNKGVGSSLMQAVVDHSAVAGTRCILQARQHLWLWYFRHGDFHVVDKAHGIMVRVGR